MVSFLLGLTEEIGHQLKTAMSSKYRNYLWNENAYVLLTLLYMVRFSYIYFREELSDGLTSLHKMKFNLDSLNPKLLTHRQLSLP